MLRKISVFSVRRSFCQPNILAVAKAVITKAKFIRSIDSDVIKNKSKIEMKRNELATTIICDLNYNAIDTTSKLCNTSRKYESGNPAKP